MTHYEQRLERDLTRIRERVKAVAVRIEEALKKGVHALLTRNRELANGVILGDLSINREIREIDRLCHAFVARHLPSAGHLRFVSSVLRLDVELERVGDYAVAIAREAVQISDDPPATVRRDIELIADQARRILGQAIRAFGEGSAELARGTKGMAYQVDATYQKVFRDLMREGEHWRLPVKDLFALMVVINRLGRVSDQAKNICEETIFAATGETKGEKTYRILFIDERNDSMSLMAEAYARKVFPESGRYASAGWNPAEDIDPHCRLFLERNGLDGGDLQPTPLDLTSDELAGFHVIVSLGRDALSRLGEIPFHTVLLEWDVGSPPRGLDAERSAALLEEIHKKLSVEVRELIETLRGEGAG